MSRFSCWSEVWEACWLANSAACADCVRASMPAVGKHRKLGMRRRAEYHACVAGKARRRYFAAVDQEGKARNA